VAELLYLAVRTNRTLVLPCVKEGRIVACSDANSHPFDSYVDIVKLKHCQ